MYLWGDTRPYHCYAAYCRRTFGRSMQKLPVDGGFTCPNRDGTVGRGGCSFCSNEAFTPAYCDPRRTVRQQVDDAIAFHRRGFPAGTGFLVYFQSYSNTHAPLERLRQLYEEALACPGVAGIVVGTRPDCAPTSPSNASRARRRPASAASGRGAICAATCCGGCSKKDSPKKTRTKVIFSYLRSVNCSQP